MVIMSHHLDQPLEYSREEQIQRFGVDCGDGIDFRGGSWVPGGEYIQKLVVRNVSSQTQKFKYKLPKTKFFSMEFPDPVRLAPGSSVVLEVRFRPVREHWINAATSAKKTQQRLKKKVAAGRL